MAEVDLYHRTFNGAFTFHAINSNGALTFAALNVTTYANGVPEAVVFIGHMFQYNGGEYEFKLQESDNGSSWDDVSSDLWFPGQPFTLTGNGPIRLGYIGKKPLVRVHLQTTNTSGADMCITAVLGSFDKSPLSDQP